MRKLSQAALTMVMAAAFTACANVGVIRLGQPVAARPEGCNLEVFAGDKEVGRAFTSVCLLDSHTGANIAEAVDASREAACACGADAIIIEQGNVTTEVTGPSYVGVGPYGRGPWAGGYGALAYPSVQERGHATLRAIKYKE